MLLELCEELKWRECADSFYIIFVGSVMNDRLPCPFHNGNVYSDGLEGNLFEQWKNDRIATALNVLLRSLDDAIHQGLVVAKQQGCPIVRQLQDLALLYPLVRNERPQQFDREVALQKFLQHAAEGGLTSIWGLLGVVPQLAPAPSNTSRLVQVAKNSYDEMVLSITALHLHAGVPILDGLASTLTHAMGVRHDSSQCVFQNEAIWVKPEVLREIHARVASGATNVHQNFDRSKLGPGTGCPARYALARVREEREAPNPMVRYLFDESLKAAEVHVYDRKA